MTEADLVSCMHDWDQAMIFNDAETIGRFMADEWTIVRAGRQPERKGSLLVFDCWRRS